MRPIHHWRVSFPLGIVQIFAWGSSYYLMAILAGPIVAETGWPLPWVIGAISLALAVAGFAAPQIGIWIARFGGRPVLTLGCSTLAAGLAIISAAPALSIFYLGWGIIGVGMAACLYDPAFSTLARLYGSNARAAITALTLWGGFASTICWPLSTLLLAHIGWRGTAACYALIQIMMCVPLILLSVPAQAQTTTVLKRPDTRQITLSSSERILLLLLSGLWIVAGLSATLISVHVLTLLRGQGLSLSEAVAIGTMLGPAQVGARVVEMAVGRHIHPIWTLVAATGAVAAGLILMALDLGLAAVAIILYGAGNGIFSIVRGTLPLVLFKQEQYPALIGRLARPSLLAQAVAPILGGILISGWGSSVTLWIIAVLGAGNVALAAVIFMRSRQPI